jgi:hypothetical protein
VDKEGDISEGDVDEDEEKGSANHWKAWNLLNNCTCRATGLQTFPLGG